MEDDYTRDEVREMATDIMATSTTKLNINSFFFYSLQEFRPKLTEVSFNPSNNAHEVEAHRIDQDNYENYINGMFGCLFFGEVDEGKFIRFL